MQFAYYDFFFNPLFFRPYLFFNWNYALISLHFKEGSRQKGVDDYVSSSRPQASSRLLNIFTLLKFQVYKDQNNCRNNCQNKWSEHDQQGLLFVLWCHNPALSCQTGFHKARTSSFFESIGNFELNSDPTSSIPNII